MGTTTVFIITQTRIKLLDFEQSQYMRGGSCCASSCLRQRFLAALRLSFLAVVGLM
jgi:hypothetical protein